ncbi:MAG TPA: CvpA family protein [Rectinemataceae bacterium]|nr:CvpA family protein [Rectinemataceae bacterium]
MNALDWVFLGVVVLLAARCFMRGFVEELLSVAAIGGGIIAALLLYRKGGDIVRSQFKVQAFPEILAFLAIFFAVFLVVKLIERMISEGLEATSLEGMDRVLGLVLGTVEGFILVSLILVIMVLLHPIVDLDNVLRHSFFAKTLLPIVGPEVARATQGLHIQVPALPAVKL